MAKQPLTEVDAMKVVDDALAGLEPEARQRVMAWAASKYHTETPKLVGGGPGREDKKSDAIPPPGVGSLGHIKDFLVKKAPSTLYERVACLAYYLEKASGITAFKANDIEKANTDARQGKIDNVPSVLADATRKYGFLSPIGEGRKALSANEAQRLIEGITIKRTPAVEEVGPTQLKTLRPNLGTSDRVLLLLYNRGQTGATAEELGSWLKPRQRANLGRALRILEHDKDLLVLTNGRYRLTRLGIREVERKGLADLT